jgi:peptidyl-prolyl cis-trans isomerase B (cyclophilin B)
MITDAGTLQLELYNETPQHRDNFIKLVREGAYDSLLFHRVIENFMIQGGDPDSKVALESDTLGNGDLPYTVPAEFHPTLFHKKGALAAARTGNPERASSSMQFYLVQGRVLTDSALIRAENLINEWLSEHYVVHEPANKSLLDSLKKAEADENWEQFMALNDSVIALAKTYQNFERYTIPEDHRQVYKTIGGTAFLDQNYTVYGEVISGLNVIDSIAKVPTDSLDRPVKDVRILKIRVVE